MGRITSEALPFNDQAVRKVTREHTGGKRDWRIDGVPGLVLRAKGGPTGGFTWFYTYTVDGLRRAPKIGEYPLQGLSDARDLADEWRKQVLAGADPIAQRHAAEVEGTTFRQLMDMRLAVGDIRPSTAAAYRKMLELDAGTIMESPASEVTARGIVKLIDKRLGKRGANRQADYFKTALSSVFKFGLSRRIVEVNPTIGLGKRDAGVPRTVTLTMEEVAVLWGGLSRGAELTGAVVRKHAQAARSFTVSAPVRAALQLMLLTGQRRGEIAGAKVSELVGLDTDAPAWVIPGDTKLRGRTARVVFGRTKNGNEQRVPLSRQAAQLFRDALALRADQRSHYVFPADLGRVKVGAAPRFPHIDPATLSRANDRFWSSAGKDGLHTHDLRRTMATWLGEAEIASDVIRLALNHSAVDVTGRVYNHAKLVGPLRRAMQMWADAVWDDGLSAAGGHAASNVVALRPAGMAAAG